MLEIQIEQIRVRCIIGVYPRERRRRQPLWIDVRLEYRDTAVAHSDDIRQGIDYADVRRQLRSWAAEGRYRTLEALAYELARRLAERYPLVRGQQITVRKPRALPGRAVAGVVYTVHEG